MKKDLATVLSHTSLKGECLEWQRALNTDGYPRASIDGNCNVKVHRVVWELYNNASAEGLLIRHKCDNPVCINPKHLEIGTPADNALDRDLRNRNGRSSLTIEQVSEIKLALSSGTRAKELATTYHVPVRTIWRISSGERYHYVSAKES